MFSPIKVIPFTANVLNEPVEPVNGERKFIAPPVLMAPMLFINRVLNDDPILIDDGIRLAPFQVNSLFAFVVNEPLFMLIKVVVITLRFAVGASIEFVKYSVSCGFNALMVLTSMELNLVPGAVFPNGAPFQ